MNVKTGHHPQATQEIDGMIAMMIETLMEKGYAYDVNERYTSVPESLKNMENYPTKIWMI